MDIAKIIPPARREYREGFNNRTLVDQLGTSERIELEEELIGLLTRRIVQKDELDNLIVDTLAYMQSQKSLPVLYKALQHYENPCSKIIIASIIYELCVDVSMIPIVLDTMKQVENTFALIICLLYLRKFSNSKDVTNILEKYALSNDFLVRINATRALEKIASGKG